MAGSLGDLLVVGAGGFAGAAGVIHPDDL